MRNMPTNIETRLIMVRLSWKLPRILSTSSVRRAGAETRASLGKSSRSRAIVAARSSDRAATIARLRELLPKDARVSAPARRTEEVDKILGSFQLNLTMMSLVSMFVGMFLIYNTVSASVVRRQHEIGILRSLGVTRNEVRMLFLGEAAALGAIGASFGLLGG